MVAPSLQGGTEHEEEEKQEEQLWFTKTTLNLSEEPSPGPGAKQEPAQPTLLGGGSGLHQVLPAAPAGDGGRPGDLR